MKIRIFDPDNWREIGMSLSRNKTRTLLTAFGIFWGTAMLAILWGASQGFEGVMMRKAAGFAENSAFGSANQRTIPYKGYPKGSYWRVNNEDLDIIRSQAPAIDAIAGLIQLQATAEHKDKRQGSSILGVGVDYQKLIGPLMTAGRFLNESDISAKRKVVVIGENLASTFFGQESPVGQRIAIDGVFYSIVGVATQKSDVNIGAKIQDSFIMPLTTLQEKYNRGNEVGFFIFSAPPGHKVAENFPVVRRVFSSRHSVSPDDTDAVWLMDISEQFEKIGMLFAGISALAIFVGAGALLSGIIGIGNIMWIIVKERTHEFGVRRAIGATPADITAQVLSESILLTLIAGIAGISFATGVLFLLDNGTADPILGKAGFVLPLWQAILILVVFFIAGAAAGTLPAVRAMRIKPIEALRDKQ